MVRQAGPSSPRVLHLALLSLIFTLASSWQPNLIPRGYPSLYVHQPYLHPPPLPTTRLSAEPASSEGQGAAPGLEQQESASQSFDGEEVASLPPVVARALAFLGARYQWGGTTPNGFDCSGFVQYVFAQEGLWLPRDLGAQLGVGNPVARSALLPGDLVFFENTSEAGLSHVGIYVGSGRFISAVSEEAGVALRSLSDPFWSPRYLAARRLLL